MDVVLRDGLGNAAPMVECGRAGECWAGAPAVHVTTQQWSAHVQDHLLRHGVKLSLWQCMGKNVRHGIKLSLWHRLAIQG